MGKVMIVYRIYPEEGYDLGKLVSDLGKIDKIKAVQREPVAYGLEVIKVGVMLEDKVDNPSDYENRIRKVRGVRNVEDVDITLIS